MEGVRRTGSGQNDGQVVARPVEGDELPPDISAISMEKGGKTVTIGRKKISIPCSKVCGNAFRTSSVTAIVSPGVHPWWPAVGAKVNISSKSWLELTMENTANLTVDEIIQLLSHSGTFDVSILGYILFLPDGYSIAVRVINTFRDCLLKAIGESLMSAYYFTHILFEGKFLRRDKGQVPAMGSLRSTVQAKCESQLQGPPQASMDDRIAVLAQAMKETYTDENRRRQLESNLRNLIDLIFIKLTPPNKENQVYWNNICRTIEDNADRVFPQNGYRKFKELQKRFPVLSSTSRPFSTKKVNTDEEKGNKEPRKVEGKSFVVSSTSRPFSRGKENRQFKQDNNKTTSRAKIHKTRRIKKVPERGSDRVHRIPGRSITIEPNPNNKKTVKAARKGML
ncbi:MAG: hypothetical protein LBC11_03075 [Puniceicoccales bacterium]|jgi:hypothetical protein|nr:hypothetical protein [Puniceicoccales bacterium]